jgi:predicted nucleic acid-binding protein
MSYWDTSCLVKLYTPETDSAVFRAHLATTPDCVTCDVAPLEFWATVRRKEAEGVLAAGQARQVQNALQADITAGMIRVISCDVAVLGKFDEFIDQCHAATPPIFLRTNDALHLAAARSAGETEIVTTDRKLRAAAVALGFSIYPAP